MNTRSKIKNSLSNFLRRPYLVLTIIALLVAFIVLGSQFVFADEGGSVLADLAKQGSDASPDEVANTPFVKYSDLFELRTVVMDAIRGTMWWLIKLLYFFSLKFEGILKEMSSFFGFVESIAKTNLYTSLLSGLSVALMVATLTYIGIKNVLGSDIKYNSVFKNTVIVIILIVGMPSLMGWMNEGANMVWDAVMKSESTTNEDLSTTVIQKNVYDLYLPLSGQMNFGELEKANPPSAINSKEAVGLVNINEYYSPKEKEIPEAFTKSGSDNWKVLQYSVVTEPSADAGTPTPKAVIKKIEKKGGWFTNFFTGDLLATGYYRYSFNIVYIILTLLGLIIGFATCAITLAKTYLEMGVQLIAGIPLMATDLETGQKVKHMMQTIINGFLTIAFTSLSFQMFSLTMSWMSQNVDSMMLQLIGLIAAVMLLAQGSKTILNWYGVDLGLAEGFSMSRLLGMRAVEAGLRGLGHSAKGVGNLMKNSSRQEDDESLKDSKALNESDQEKNTESIREDLGEFVRGASKAGAFAKNMGVSGLAAAGLNAVSQKAKDTASDVTEAAHEAVHKGKSAVHSFGDTLKSASTEGFEEGRESAEQTKQAMEAKRRSKDISKVAQAMSAFGSTLEENSTDDNIRNIQEGLSDYQRSGSLSRSQMDNLMKDLEEAREMPKQQADSHIRQALQRASNDLLQNDQDAQAAQARTDSAQNQRLNQILANMNDLPQANGQELKQSLSKALEENGVEPEKIQKIRQEVEKAAKDDPEDLRQKVLQMLSGDHPSAADFNAQADHQEAVQRIRQELDKASNADSEDLRQRLLQTLSSDTAKEAGQSEVVQKVRQEVEKATNVSPEDLRQKVLQMLNQENTHPSSSTLRRSLSDQDQEVLQKVRQQFEKSDVNQLADFTQNVHQKLMAEGMSPLGAQTIEQQVKAIQQGQLGRQRQEVEQILRQNFATQTPTLEGLQKGRMEVQQVIKQADFSQPSQAVQQVIRQVENNGLSHIGEAKQAVVQELQKAGSMYPSQAKAYTQAVLSKVNTGSLTTDSLKQSLSQIQVQSHMAPINSVDRSIGQSVTNTAHRLYSVGGETMADKTATLSKGIYRSASSPQIVANTTGQILKQSGLSIPSATQQEVVQKVRQVREEASASHTPDEVVKQRVQQTVSPILSSGGGLSLGQVQNLSEHVANASVGHTLGTERLAKAVGRASMASPSQFRRNVMKQVGTIPQAVQQDIEQVVQQAHSQNLTGKEAHSFVYNQIKQKSYGANTAATQAQEQILNVVDSSLQASRPQVQANLKKLGKLEEQYYQQDE